MLLLKRPLSLLHNLLIKVFGDLIGSLKFAEKSNVNAKEAFCEHLAFC